MKNKEKKLSFGTYLGKHKLGIAVYLLMYALASASTIATTFLAAQFIVKVTASDWKAAITLLLFTIGAYVLRRLFYWIADIIFFRLSYLITSDLNGTLARQAFKLNSKTFSDHNSGTFVQRIVNDPGDVVNRLSAVVEIVTDTMTSFIIMTYISFVNWVIGLIILGTLVISYFVEMQKVKVKNRELNRVKKERENVVTLTTEIVRSEKDIKSLGLEKQLSQISNERYNKYNRAGYVLNFKTQYLWTIRTTIVEIMGIVMLLVGIFFMKSDPAMLTLASFMIIYSNREGLRGFVWGVGRIVDMIQEIKISCNRMFSLFDENKFVTEKFGNTHLEKINGGVEFKNVSFAYVEYEDEDNLTKKGEKIKENVKKERKIVSTNQIFNNLSFKIKPNTSVAFVGRSGSGKSTILNLMAKMYEVDDGQILIDGVNINDLDKETLRGNVSLVNQFPYIFDMTIKENLLLAKEGATDEEVNDAIKRASLSEFVSSLPMGVDTKVGESGIKLSGGQKQRLAIARALLRNSPIIIFDESTSSLDNFAQNEIKKTIDGLKGSSTIVVVAHRLSTIKDVDQIFFLEDGKIQAIGTFDELFETNVKFKNMFYAENLE